MTTTPVTEIPIVRHVLVVIAMQSEAEPLIKELSLTKDTVTLPSHLPFTLHTGLVRESASDGSNKRTYKIELWGLVCWTILFAVREGRVSVVTNGVDKKFGVDNVNEVIIISAWL